MLPFVRTAVVVLAMLGLSACNSFNEFRYSTFDAAMALDSRIEDPPVVMVSAMPEDLPGMVVFASINGDFANIRDAGRQAWYLRKEADRLGLRPDLLTYEPRQAAYAGSTSQYLGYGMAMSTPVYRPQGTVHCFRLSPVSLGLKWNSIRMLTWVAEETRGGAGIQEGDTLLSINGKSIERPASGTAPSEGEILRIQPGDPVSLVWIRPGMGRMEGKAVAREPMPIPSTIESIATKPERRD